MKYHEDSGAEVQQGVDARELCLEVPGSNPLWTARTRAAGENTDQSHTTSNAKCLDTSGRVRPDASAVQQDNVDIHDIRPGRPGNEQIACFTKKSIGIVVLQVLLRNEPGTYRF